MKNKKFLIFLVSVCFLIFLGVVFLAKERPENIDTVPTENVEPDSLKTEWKTDNLRFVAHEDAPTDWKTDLYVGEEKQPRLSFNGYYLDSKFQNLDITGAKYLEVILLQGKLVNSNLFKDISGQLEKVLVFDSRGQKFLGIIASADPEYKDIDGDGIREMFVYHRHYPPAYKRAVEVYQFRNEAFWKWKEYEEDTQELFL